MLRRTFLWAAAGLASAADPQLLITLRNHLDSLLDGSHVVEMNGKDAESLTAMAFPSLRQDHG